MPKLPRPTKAEVRLLRNQGGYTQQQAADICGFHVHHWEKIEAGTRNISLNSWEKFLTHTGLMAEYKKMKGITNDE